MLRGGLFTREYLLEGIKETDAWKALDPAAVEAARTEIEKRLAAIRKLKKPNEAETESELIWPALAALGWAHSLPQQNLSVGGREKVPDGLLFADGDTKDKAAAEKSWSPQAYARKFGAKSAADIVKADVLALTYTANDMTPFARDMGYDGPPFAWDEAERARRRARLDALYFMLYFPSGAADEIAALRDTAAYIFSTFPIVEREDIAAHGRYLSRDLCLAYLNALAAGDPDATIAL